MKRFVLLLQLLLCCSAVVQSADAQQETAPPNDSPARSAAPAPERPMPWSARSKIFGAGLGGTTLAISLAGAAGFIAYRVVDDPVLGSLAGSVIGLGIAGYAVPVATAKLVQRTGRRLGYQGTFGSAYGGAIGGFALGGVGSALTTLVLLSSGAPRWTIAPALVLAPTACACFSMIAYRGSDRRRVSISPTLARSATGHGAAVGLAGRF